MSENSAQTTPIASFFSEKDSNLALGAHLGRQMVEQWRAPQQEFLSLLASASVFDLGYRCLFRVTGSDQVRWLNGMITNTIQDLVPGHSNYSFVLNAQGRILGDLTAYRCSDHILLATDTSQTQALYAHLDHFIIMDDVVLEPLDGYTAIGLAGPKAASLLAAAGLPVPSEAQAFAETEISGQRLIVSQEYSPLTPRFSIFLPEAATAALWEKLLATGASPAGFLALETLRLAEAVPQYGIDFGEKYLPQEVDATRPLHFHKGCYLGQEIVERIRSRASVHRQMRLFELESTPPALPAPILAPEQSEDKPVGEITSAARLDLPSGQRTLALGMVKNEPVARNLHLSCQGASLRVLDDDSLAVLRETLRNLASHTASVS